jgi:hypothetical protein
MAVDPNVDTGKGGIKDVSDFAAEISSMTKSAITKSYKQFDELQKDVAAKQIDYNKEIRDTETKVLLASSNAAKQRELANLSILQQQKAAIDSYAKTLGDIEKAERAASKERIKERIEAAKSIGGALGAGGLISFVSGGWVNALTKALEFIKDILFGANEQAVKISKAFQVTSEDSDRIRQSLIDQGRGEVGLLANINNRIKAQQELLANSKLTYVASKDQLDTQIKLVEALGMSADEASKLNDLFVGNNTEGSKGTKIAYDQIALFAKQEGMLFNSKKILQDVSNVSGQIRATYKGSVEELTKAVLQAAKLGTTIEQTKSMSETLLNFESSIDNELKAELLTGQQLNLEKARALALSGDYVAAGKEMLDQAGGLENYQKLNVIQQKALAESIGMSADQMADVLFKQSVQGKQANDLAAQYRSIGAIDMARALEAGEIQGEQLEQAQQRLTAERQFSEAMEQVKTAIGSLVSGGFLDKMAELVQEIATSFSAVVIDLKNGKSIVDILFNGVSAESQAKVAQSQMQNIDKRAKEGDITAADVAAEKKKIMQGLASEADTKAKGDLNFLTKGFDYLYGAMDPTATKEDYEKTRKDNLRDEYYKEMVAALNKIATNPVPAVLSRNQMDMHSINGKVQKPS